MNETKPTDFDQFWQHYPLRVGKKDARRAWDRATDKPDLETLLAAIARSKLSKRWEEGFIPNPATWLNQGRWDDELPLANPAVSKAKIPPFPGPEDPIGRNLWRKAYGNLKVCD